MAGDNKEAVVAAYNVKVAGKELTQESSEGMEALFVEDHVDMIGLVKVTLNAESFPWSEVTIGGDAEVKMGGDGNPLFKGVVTGIRHHGGAGGIEMITVVGMDPLCKLGASRHTRVWEEMTDSSIAEDVLGQAGVTVGTVDSTSGENPYVIQRNESDLVFLKRLAARNGYLLRATGEGKIDFVKVQYGGSATEFGKPELIKFDYTVSHQSVPPELKVVGWSYLDKEMVEGTASSGDVDDIGSGANAAAETGTVWQAPVVVTDVHVSTAGSAQAMAIAELNRLARSFVRGNATIAGNAAVRAGVKVKFKDFATGFNPEVYVVRSRHVVRKGIYETEFEFVGANLPA